MKGLKGSEPRCQNPNFSGGTIPHLEVRSDPGESARGALNSAYRSYTLNPKPPSEVFFVASPTHKSTAGAPETLM